MSLQKYNFANKVALVTGSSSGIGAAIAIQLAQFGARVTITGRDASNLEKMAQKIESVSNGNVKPLKLIGNLRDDSSFPKKLIDETVAKFGRLDILVNNAAQSTPIGALSSPNLLEELDQVLKLNVKVPVELIQLAVAHLEKTQGNVINISSISAIMPMQLVYSTSKAALDMVTKASALELGPKRIRVNTISPGPVVTTFGRSRGWDQAHMDKFFPALRQQSLMGRIGEAEDIANLASFLASDDARNITGSIFNCDSGMVIYPPRMNMVNLEIQK